VAAEGNQGIDVREYLIIARRHIVLILLITIALGAAAYFYSNSKPAVYEATSRLLYEPELDVTNPLSGGGADPYTQALQLQSATLMISSPEIYDRVAAFLGNPSAWPSYSVYATIEAADIQSDSNPNVLSVAVRSQIPAWSAKLANAYARQFVEWRVQAERQRIDDAAAVIREKLDQYTTDAERASSDYFILSERLQDLEILSETTTGNFRIVVPAYAPSTPVSPKPLRSALMGAAAGLVIGLGLAFLREKLDTRVRSHREVGDIMGMPIVGRIPEIPQESLSRGPLVVVREAEGRAAESLRLLRTNLEFAALGDEHHVLMVVSAQKGEGKSVLTANLAASLAMAGKHIVLVDADLRRPHVHRLFNLPNIVGVSSIVAGKAKIAESLQTYDVLKRVRVSGGNGKGVQPAPPSYDTSTRLTLLTAGPVPPNPGEMVASQRFCGLIRELAQMPFDYVLIDSPAFLAVGDASALAACVDGIFVLVNMKMTGRLMLEEARDFLEPLPAPKLGVITVFDQAGSDERYHYYGRY
jgi:Mrp family chromosome partitioning ATPase/capsular polysaccharide biosynthesis protein